MPYTRRQVRFLESSGSPLTAAQKSSMNAELHSDPSLGHHKKGSKSMEKYASTHIKHHEDGSHSVEHEGHMKKASEGGAFMEKGEGTSYAAKDGKSLMSKLKEHLGIGAAKAAGSQEEELEPSKHEPPHEKDEVEEEDSEGE